ncbi:MAG: hypothetical protein EBZ77_13320, partial [Chitinophagia bacterium]|nr:hypothetical protein [Chitinophagia bacterium]
LSQKGTQKDQQTSATGLEADGVLQLGKKRWDAGIFADNRQYRYYGFNHDLYSFSGDSLKQHYTTVGASVTMENTPALGQFYWKPQVTASFLFAAQNVKEQQFGLVAPFRKRMDSTLDLAITVSAYTTNLNRPALSGDNNLISAKPGVELNLNNITGYGYIAFASGKGGNGYILPDIAASYRASAQLIAGAGWNSWVERNTYQSLTNENPYISPFYTITQTRKDELFVCAEGSMNDHITYSARLSWWALHNMPLYAYGGPVANSFTVLYTDANALSLMGALRYTLAEKWSAGLNASYFNYYNVSTRQPLQIPAVRATGDATVTVTPKLTVTGYLYVLAGIKATDATGKNVTLKPGIDLGGGAEYQLTNRLNAFGQINNLLNNHYERWVAYQSYGFNIYGGIRLKF